MLELARIGETPPPVWALKTRWLLPGAGPPIADAVVTIASGQIVAIGENQSGRQALDWGPVTVIPGFVNSHTHLEFGNLAEPLGAPGLSFSDWLREVVGQRRSALASRSVEQLAEERAAGTRQSLDELARGGVTLLAEIARPGWSSATLTDAPSTQVYLELLGLDPSRVPPLLELAKVHLEAALPPANRRAGMGETVASSAGKSAPRWRAGLSPHAPYSVHLDLLAGACRLSRERDVPLAMHLAESWDELELLASHSGPLVEVLEEFNAWNPSFLPRGLRPRDYLERLAVASRALVVHGNFLNSSDWAFLAEHRERMALVYCPRTHARFLQSKYPLAEILAAGVRVAIGTDSRATNPDLDFLTELRWTAQRHSEVSPENVLALGTTEAARALGDDERGCIAVHKRADLVVVESSGGNGNPWGWLVDDATPRIIAVVREGRPLGSA